MRHLVQLLAIRILIANAASKIHRVIGIGTRSVFALVSSHSLYIVQASSRIMATPMRHPLHSCQWRREFTVAIPIDKWKKIILKKFIAPLVTASKFVLSAVANNCGRCQSQLCAPLRIRNIIANSSMRWRCNFKELSRDGGRADFYKKNHCKPLFNDYLSNEPMLSARSISLDSTFTGHKVS